MTLEESVWRHPTQLYTLYIQMIIYPNSSAGLKATAVHMFSGEGLYR